MAPTPMSPPHEGHMPSHLYRAFPGVDLPDRTWPSGSISKAPQWCSVDLRDGNQALINPMDPERKRKLWEMLIAVGFKEIEVGFPSASQPDWDFIREIIEGDLIPDDVTIQVLTQARDDLITRTYEALRGAKNVIVHLYNSTSTLQRRVVFGMDTKGILDLAVKGAELCRSYEDKLGDVNVRYEYSPESFTGTELPFAAEVCNAVGRVFGVGSGAQMIMNLPSTVEMATPNVYADQIEWMCRNLDHRDDLIISLHPHNDRGTGVAAAELALMAGADRVEGTLFGNGERTGNVDIVTLAMNMFTQGVDPLLDFSDIDAVRRVAEYATELPVHPRHPYVGDLVFTAFSGSHQDAINKGFKALGEQFGTWEVPYLPIDPKHVGRTYEDVIRVNSQSGKGGVTYIMRAHHGFELPRRLQIEFSRAVQSVTDTSGKEINAEELLGVFRQTYLETTSPLRWIGNLRSETTSDGKTSISVDVEHLGNLRSIEGAGNGPIAAFVNALGHLDIHIDVADYSEHSVSSGASAKAACYVESTGMSTQPRWGVGLDGDIVTASLKAVVSSVNRHATFSASQAN